MIRITHFVYAVVVAIGLQSTAQAAKYRVVPSFPAGEPVPGQQSVLQFSLFKEGEELPLAADRLRVEHERKIHLFFLDSGFVTFLHEHPEEVSPGVWQVPFKAGSAGQYRVWAEFKPVDEEKTQRPFFDTRIAYCPYQVVPDKPVDESVKLIAKDGDYQITLFFPSGEPIQHGMSELSFRVEKDGVLIPGKELDNYLGSKMHVSGVSADKGEFVHSHPGHGTPTTPPPTAIETDPDLTLKVHYMMEGFYGVFMQFVHEGKLRTAQFAIQVKPSDSI